MVTQHPLRAFRREHAPPLTKAALARLLDVSKTTVARWENGSRKIEPELLPLVSERTGIAAHALRPDLAELMAPTPQPAESAA